MMPKILIRILKGCEFEGFYWLQFTSFSVETKLTQKEFHGVILLLLLDEELALIRCIFHICQRVIKLSQLGGE